MKSFVFTMLSLLLSFTVCFLIWWQWKDYGVVEEREKATFSTPDSSEAIPEILTVNRRLIQNQKIKTIDLAEATDVDGSDLSPALCCYDEKGNLLSGFLDTRVPGKYYLKWVVRSRVNGRMAEKKTIILVDGRAVD